MLAGSGEGGDSGGPRCYARSDTPSLRRLSTQITNEASRAAGSVGSGPAGGVLCGVGKQTTVAGTSSSSTTSWAVTGRQRTVGPWP